MKKIIFTCISALILSVTTLLGQHINLSKDSIAVLLCKKWEVNYAMMGGMKIGKIPGAAEINYEFNKDKTFLMTSNNPKDKTNGTWSYDDKKKLIKLTINGKSNSSIISLTNDEFVILEDSKNATPDDPMEMRLVYKIKAK